MNVDKANKIWQTEIIPSTEINPIVASCLIGTEVVSIERVFNSLICENCYLLTISVPGVNSCLINRLPIEPNKTQLKTLAKKKYGFSVELHFDTVYEEQDKLEIPEHCSICGKKIVEFGYGANNLLGRIVVYCSAECAEEGEEGENQ